MLDAILAEVPKTCWTPSTPGRCSSRTKRLAGIPADVLAAARAAAEEEGKPGWKLTLKMPCYLPVMQYARDRDLREALYPRLRHRRVGTG